MNVDFLSGRRTANREIKNFQVGLSVDLCRLQKTDRHKNRPCIIGAWRGSCAVSYQAQGTAVC